MTPTPEGIISTSTGPVAPEVVEEIKKAREEEPSGEYEFEEDK